MRRERSSERAASASPSWSPELESLRGIAIVLVVLFHAHGVMGSHLATDPQATGPLGAFFLAGHTGVTLFFVLSGFLLAPAFIAEARGGPVVGRRGYLARRARRILPLYYLFVAIGSVLTASTLVSVLRGVPYLLFLNAWPFADMPFNLWPWSGVWWSLATEVQFYLLLPLLAWVGRGRWGRMILGASLVLYGASYLFAVGGGLEEWPRHWRIRLFASVFDRGPAFAFGALAALVAPSLHRRSGQRAAEWLRRWCVPDLALLPPLAEAVLLLIGAVALSAFSYHYFERRFIVRGTAHSLNRREVTLLPN